MSKKTPNPVTGKHSEARLKRAKEVLDMHPTRDKVYFTADDECFIEPQFAYMHAASKGDDTVTTITRDELTPNNTEDGTPESQD